MMILDRPEARNAAIGSPGPLRSFTFVTLPLSAAMPLSIFVPWQKFALEAVGASEGNVPHLSGVVPTLPAVPSARLPSSI